MTVHAEHPEPWSADCPDCRLLTDPGCVDPLAPSKGIAWGMLLGCLLWVGIFGGAAVVLSRVIR